MKRNLILLVVFIALAAVVYLMFYQPAEPPEAKEEKLMYPNFDMAKAAKVEMMNVIKHEILEKRGDEWVVGAKDKLPKQPTPEPKEGETPAPEPTEPPVEYFKADQDAVQKLLEIVKNLEKKELASKNKEKHKQFQIDNMQGVEVLVSDNTGTEMAHFIVGKYGPDFSSTYVAKAGQDEVYLVEGFIKQNFDKGGVSGWRDKTIFDIEPSQITQLTVKDFVKETIQPKEGRGKAEVILSDDPVRTITFMKDNDTWKINALADQNIDQTLVEEAVKTFAQFKAAGYPAEHEKEKFALDKPRYIFTAKLANGTEQKMIVGGEKYGTRLYAKRASAEQVFTAEKKELDKMLKGPDAYIAKKPDAEQAPAGAFDTDAQLENFVGDE